MSSYNLIYDYNDAVLTSKRPKTSFCHLQLQIPVIFYSKWREIKLVSLLISHKWAPRFRPFFEFAVNQSVWMRMWHATQSSNENKKKTDSNLLNIYVRDHSTIGCQKARFIKTGKMQPLTVTQDIIIYNKSIKTALNYTTIIFLNKNHYYGIIFLFAGLSYIRVAANFELTIWRASNIKIKREREGLCLSHCSEQLMFRVILHIEILKK